MLLENILQVHIFTTYILYTDCQQKAGPSAWTPFHESASAVTQLYKGTLEHFVLLNLCTHL